MKMLRISLILSLLAGLSMLELEAATNQNTRKRKLPSPSHADLERLCGKQQESTTPPIKKITLSQKIKKAIKANDYKAVVSALESEGSEDDEKFLKTQLIKQTLVNAIDKKQTNIASAILNSKKAMSYVTNLNSALYKASKNGLYPIVKLLLEQEPSTLITEDGILNAITTTKSHTDKLKYAYGDDPHFAIKDLLEADQRGK